jgi:uncharacterized protein (TIGR02001 family)
MRTHPPTTTMPDARTLRLALALAALPAGPALAQAAPSPAPATPAVAPEHTLAANVGLFSEYLFRGIAQTAGKPALQGGFDYAHASGFYAGTWASNASWLEDFGQYDRSSLEWDLYAGYRNAFPGQSDWTYDAGIYYYAYPGSRASGAASANTLELYGAVGWRWASGKASYTASRNYFGTRPNGQDTRGTWYFDLSAAYPVADTGFALVAHAGLLDVRHDGGGDLEASYADWRIGFAYTVPDGVLKGLEAGAYYSGNDATRAFYTDLTGYDTSKSRGVVYVKKTF